MLSNEVFAIECRKKYEEQGLIVDKTNGQFAHCPYPEGMGDSGYYLLWADHQHQGLLQSRDVGRRCFWVGDAKRWLDEFPEGYFELCDIFQEFVSGEHCGMTGRIGELNPMFGKKRPDLSERNRTQTKKGELSYLFGRTGELHPAYGRKRPDVSERMSGKRWWVNSEGECRFDKEPPGPDWQHGRKWKVG